MATVASSPVPTPERFFNAINAHQQTAAMKAAIELDIFTAIAEGNAAAAAIAKRCECAERGTRILCDLLTIHGFLTKDGSEYGLAPDAALFLNRQSPAYMGCTIDFLLNPRMLEGHALLTESVRRGSSALGEVALEPDSPIWVKFAQAMMPMMFMPAQMVAAELSRGGEARKVLDIAAGHGVFGIAVAKQNPEAHVYAADWKNVLEVASGNAQAMGVGDRHHLLPGSAFETEFDSDFDLVLVPNFLHHFDAATCTDFMRKVHAALMPGGRAAIVEFVPNPDRVTPPMAASFSMMMLASTPAGDAYTFAELESIAKEAGFTRVELVESQFGISRLVIAYR